MLLTGGEPHGGSIDRGGSGSISQEARRGAAANRADSRVGVQIEAPSINGDAAGLTRPLRIDFPGALYHLSSRGDRRESIFAGDADRLDFLDVPAPGCERFDADVHAYCLMGNHDPLMLAARQRVEPAERWRTPLAERVAVVSAQMERGPMRSAESYPDECWTFC
ncbi:MAG TPA: hypothetical protein PKA84_02380, partial [Rubrivivax sp.]|nr:hypothetical protein [Rubrivivax sp.]